MAEHSVDLSVQSFLLMQSLDPGLARYLGLMTRTDDTPQPGEPLVYVALAMFALQRLVLPFVAVTTLYDELGEQPDLMERVVQRHIERVESRTRRPGDFKALAAQIARRPLGAVRAALAICGVVPPHDRPRIAAPSVLPGRAHWIGRPALPSNAFRQDLTWPIAPLGSLVALGRLEADGWQSRHRPAPLAPDGDSPPRVLPLLLGRSADRDPAVAQAFLSDAPVPSEFNQAPVALRYRIALADMFGRFGPAAEFEVAPPARPAPTPPTPQLEVILDGSTGAEVGPASPGHIAISVPVPNVVDLPSGSLPLASLHLSFEGSRIDVDLVADVLVDVAARRAMPVVTAQFALPALAVARQSTGLLTATFEDTGGTVSKQANIHVGYGDRRPHPVIPSGLGLLWTSRPGPGPEVELKLTWHADAGAIYCIFIADAIGLGLPPGPRAHQAVEAGVRARNRTLGARERFRLLGEVNESGGIAVADERLPRSLASVQILRIVPLTSKGREAPFDDCPVVPVAVPGDRRPPAARVAVNIDELTGRATLRIEAGGLDWQALKAAEPGLFLDPPSVDARAPEYRLRRAYGAVPEPIYAREIARGTLTLQPDGESWRAVADFEEPAALAPYVRCTWWVEVRLGAERRVRAGFEEVPPAGGVQPMIDAQQQDLPQPFSLPSAPASALRTLPVPSAPDDAVVSLVDPDGTRQWTLQVPTTPSTARTAIAPYYLRLWEQWGDASIVSAGKDIAVHGDAMQQQWTSRVDAAAVLPAALLIAYVDPLGRVGPIARMLPG